MKLISHIKISTVLSALTGLAFGLPLFALILNGSFMRLYGDDYCYQAVIRQVGVWAAPIYSYFNVAMFSASRFSLTLLYAISGLFGPWVNGVQPGLAVVLWAAGLYYALRGLFQWLSLPVSRPETALAAASLEFFTLFYAPALEQVVYWQSAMLTYTAPLVVFSFVVGILLHIAHRRKKAWPAYLGLFLLSFLAGGFSETADALMVGLLGLILLAALWGWWRKREPSRALLLPACLSLAGVLLALLVLFLSPNNQIRQLRLNLPPPPDLFTLIQASLYDVRIFLSITIRRQTLPNLAILLFGFALMGMTLIRTKTPLRFSFRQWAAGQGLIIAACFLLLVAIMAPSEYGQSSYPIGRALLNARFVVVLGASFAGALTALWLAPRLPARLPANAIQAALATCLLLTGIFPVQAAAGQFARTHHYQRWAAFWDKRDVQIRQAAADNQNTIDVVQIDKIIPDVAELSPDPNAFYNNCAEFYYGIAEIRANLPGWDP